MTTRKTAQAEEPKPAPNIYQKLHLAKQSMGKVIKNATNPHLKRNYADINSTGGLAWLSWLNKLDFVDITWHGMIQHNMCNKETRIHPTQKPVVS